MALYRAKADGRGVFRFFEPEMDATIKARRALENALREALYEGQFTCTISRSSISTTTASHAARR